MGITYWNGFGMSDGKRHAFAATVDTESKCLEAVPGEWISCQKGKRFVGFKCSGGSTGCLLRGQINARSVLLK